MTFLDQAEYGKIGVSVLNLDLKIVGISASLFVFMPLT